MCKIKIDNIKIKCKKKKKVSTIFGDIIQRIQEDIFKPYEKFILLFCVIETINLRS